LLGEEPSHVENTHIDTTISHIPSLWEGNNNNNNKLSEKTLPTSLEVRLAKTLVSSPSEPINPLLNLAREELRQEYVDPIAKEVTKYTKDTVLGWMGFWKKSEVPSNKNTVTIKPWMNWVNGINTSTVPIEWKWEKSNFDYNTTGKLDLTPNGWIRGDAWYYVRWSLPLGEETLVSAERTSSIVEWNKTSLKLQHQSGNFNTSLIAESNWNSSNLIAQATYKFGKSLNGFKDLGVSATATPGGTGTIALNGKF
jgi:hypothetical protein